MHVATTTPTQHHRDRPNQPKNKKDPSYLDQGCPLTLRQGLAEFIASDPALIAADEDTEVGRLTTAHDCCHVLFGLTTAIGDEAVADTWTLVGSDVTLRQYAAFLRHDEYKQLVVEVATWRSLVETMGALPRVLRAIVHGRRMAEKWPFFGYAAHLDTPLVELRQRFTITLVPRPR